jgi:hypothetical protein
MKTTPSTISAMRTAALSAMIPSMAGRNVTILFKESEMSDDNVTEEGEVVVLLAALYVMLVAAVPPRIAWKSFEASFGSTRASSFTYGFPMLLDESKSPKS